MAKDPSSLHAGRRGLSWIKLKKDFATLTAVVAVEYGNGRRSTVLSDYTFAVREEASGALLPIGKAYSGLTDLEIGRANLPVPQAGRLPTGNRIEVEPQIIVEVAFDSIQASSSPKRTCLALSRVLNAFAGTKLSKILTPSPLHADWRTSKLFHQNQGIEWPRNACSSAYLASTLGTRF